MEMKIQRLARPTSKYGRTARQLKLDEWEKPQPKPINYELWVMQATY